MAQFASGLTAVSSSKQSGKTQIEADIEAYQVSSFADDRTAVALSPPDCIPKPSADGTPQKIIPCVIVSASAGASSPPPDVAGLSTAITDLAATDPLFSALDKYASSLTAVVNAGDQASFQAAAKSFSDATTSLVGSITSGSTVSSDVGAAANITGDIAGRYLDKRRLQVLKTGVAAVDPYLATVEPVLSVALDRIKTARGARLLHEAQVAEAALSAQNMHAISSEEYTKRYAVLEADVDAINELNSVSPSLVVQEMIKAHSSLNVALKTGKGQLGALFEDAQDFDKDAIALNKAFSATPTTKQ